MIIVALSMNINLKKLALQLTKKGNSSTILLEHTHLEDQLNLGEQLAREILKIQQKETYRSHPDVFGIWPGDQESKSISIQQIHQFIRKTQLKPFASKFKIGIITQSEKMTPQAQNAILKTLEEPPANTFIILTTSNRNKLLPTILSRCQSFRFRDERAEDGDKILVNSIIKGSIVDKFEIVEKIVMQKDKSKQYEEIELILKGLLNHYRQKLLSSHKDTTRRQQLLETIELIETTREVIDKNVNIRLALESLMINLSVDGDK